VDKDFIDVGKGSVAPKPSASCGVDIDFATYRPQSRGDTGAQVKAAQCLLKQRGYYSGKITGRFDLATRRATARFQGARHLAVTGSMTRSTWTALLSAGETPVLKRGSASNAVRRVQRALNAAGDARLPVTGVFGAGTTTAAMAYQRAVGLPTTGVVASDTWAMLKSGRR
jgi:peptidoglycan hydrolase-like protein with peptidoglycan-binding domain